MIGFEVSSFLPTLLDINSFCPTLTSISRRFKEGATNIHGYSASKWRRGGVPVHRICLEGRQPRRPDQSRHRRERDGSADLYAVGVTLYRMLTGMLPAPEPLPPSAFNPDLDAAWDAFMQRALSRHPSGRFSSAVAMGESLEHLERAWQDQRARICRLAPPPEAAW